MDAGLLFTWWEAKHDHGRPDACPGCGAPMSTTGITRLVYTFEVCSCGEPGFDHLVETLWHRACFSTAPCPGFTPFHVRGVRGRPARDTKECIRCGLTEAGHAGGDDG
jgi:hypothetical protein